MVRKSGRSRSRGRPDRFEDANYEKTAAKATPAKTPKAASKKAAKAAEPEEPKGLEFVVGDAVMARWPGSSLFFKAKVTFVREEDEEYDVEYENGTVYTIRAKDVYKADSKVLKKAAGTRRSKSRGRGRSAARDKKPAKAKADESSADEGDKTDAKPAAKTPRVSRSTKVVETPTRQSARIAAKATDAFSDNEEEKVKLAPNPELPDARGKIGRAHV